MKLDIQTIDVTLTDGMKSAMVNTVNELDHYFKENEPHAKAIFKKYPHGYKVEIMVFVSEGITLRQDIVSPELYQAIDLAGKKLELQIFKARGQMKKIKTIKPVFSEVNAQKDEVHNVIRRKSLALDFISEEEAILQFELSGHDFYVFKDADTENTTVLYKRNDDSYGMIEMV